MSGSVTFFAARRRVGSEARRAGLSVTCLGLFFTATAGFIAACSPYPDDGEFLAGTVYSTNFIAGVKRLDQTPAVGRGYPVTNGVAPYTVVQTTSGTGAGTAVTATAPATNPFWNNGGKRQPLDRGSVQQVYVFDSSCAAPRDYTYDPRLDLIRLDRQYPIFADIPEVLSTNAGKAGRTAAYSAIVEVIHVSGSGSIPCQSIKRFDTTQGRIGGDDGDLVEGRHEYRLFQVIDPAIAIPPLPVQLGFYNQLVLPYIDMGPVPLEPDGKTFRTMPIYKVSTAAGAAAGTVTFGHTDEAGPTYSPICRDYTLKLGAGMTLPVDATDPVFMGAMKTENLTSCLVCRTVGDNGDIQCPYAATQGQP